MASNKAKPEDLVASSRSPVIPVVYDPTADRKSKPNKAVKAEKNVPKATETPLPGTKKEVEDMSTATIREPTADEKAKPKKPGAEIPKQSNEVTFPFPAFVNEYGFLKLKDRVLKKIGWPTDKHIDVTLDFVDGALVVKKKA
jgi:hypothetical protein